MAVRARIKRGRPGKLGLVLSGGGARGAFQVGVYERLLRDPRFADGRRCCRGPLPARSRRADRCGKVTARDNGLLERYR